MRFWLRLRFGFGFGWAVVLALVELWFWLHDCGDFSFADFSVFVDAPPAFGDWVGCVSNDTIGDIVLVHLWWIRFMDTIFASS